MTKPYGVTNGFRCPRQNAPLRQVVLPDCLSNFIDGIKWPRVRVLRRWHDDMVLGLGEPLHYFFGGLDLTRPYRSNR